MTAGITVEWVCLRQGLLQFDDCPSPAIADVSVNASSNNACKKHLLAWPGRLGIATPIEWSGDVVGSLCASGFMLESADARPVLVLGTGECNAPAYLLGNTLQSRGCSVKVQSTTRSPIRLGNAIAAVCQFEDNYDDGIANFIYNLNPADYRQIILCHETPLCAALLERLREWQAISARFELSSDLCHATLHFFRP
jgi:hypothetical protein